MTCVEEVELGKRRITLETGRIARQAHAAVVARHKGAMVLATVVVQPGAADGDEDGATPAADGVSDFVSLTVEYRERMSAAGRIPGGFGKRELRISDHEVLTSRLIDRSLRPLFPKGFRDEVQILCTVYGADAKSDLESLALIAAAAALHLSPLPVGLVAGARVARVGEKLVFLPSDSEREQAAVECVLAATRDGVVMIEGGAREADEDTVVALLREGMVGLEPLLSAFERLRAAAGLGAAPIPPPTATITPSLSDDELAALEPHLAVPKSARRPLADDPRWRALVRRRALAGQRIGGRGPEDVRPIESEVAFLPSNHGSALFTRGETQALVSVTLGGTDEALVSETVLRRKTERFFLHYNFPPFSVAEIKSGRGPGRREIGHGALARRALQAVMPPNDELPFTVRIVADVLESNGSSSMATVCGASLALMDAGIRISRPVAGIAMGLVCEGDDAVVLSDISGDEDHIGDMDFKIAGTHEGITALQLDNKIGAVSLELLARALRQARQALGHILAQLALTLDAPRPTVSEHAPQIAQIRIPSHRVGTLIGPGGKTIQELQSATSTRIDVKDDGRVRVNARRAQDLKAALARIEELTLELEVGKTYPAEVVTLKEYGAFVRIGDHEGLVHISELAATRVDKVEDVLTLGETIEVKVMGADKRGRLELSRKATL